ncbi:unnamed protein product [Adineta steineri]|uniref:Matrin-type domain-containing protein n=1 Tax=Adineta steineri TaxID=433720 RepID=A0A819B2W2_9BILA|nr:unnamed protein product [Adineta steineri]CAF3794766.1 unnamed protein product [Adineta steineri]
MTHRGKFSNHRQTNNTNNPPNNNLQKDDDNCSVVCYKDSDNDIVDVVRIRQQIFCSLCNSMRGTFLLYCKHILDNNHREKVKKLYDEKCFTPTIYEQAIHLAFHNNEEIKSETEPEKMETNNNTQQKTKQKNIQVTLVFQDKKYSKIGTIIPQIREQLLKDMVTDRAADIAALPADIYYAKKNLAPDDAYYNIQNSSVKLNMAEEQSQVMLKKQQHQQQEPLINGKLSSAEISREDNGVEQVTAITTHEISTAENIDIDDDVMNVCKDVLNHVITGVYSKSDESKREREFLFGIARRRYKKRKAFFCDICSAFLTTEDFCTEHRNGLEHLEKIRHYETNFLPWRRAMQESLITGKTLKEIMDTNTYDNYKATMALYLAPNSIHNHGRFCCAYCEYVFPDQWLLEKHLNTVEHKTKQTSTNHKELVPHFADIIILPSVYKLNGMKDLSEVPSDIKKEQEWSCVTRKQLDDDTDFFLQKYPFDQFEAATPLTNNKIVRKKKSFPSTSSAQKSRNYNNNNISMRSQQGRNGGFNRTGRGQFQMSTTRRGGAVKRSFPSTPVSSKRFRPDLLNNSFPGANRGPGPMRNYETNQFNYNQSAPYNNNGNDRWPSRYPANLQQQQQRPEFFDRPNFETRSLPSNNNNGYYDNRPPQLMSGGNNYNNERQLQFNGGFSNQQSNYERPYNNHSISNPMNEYHPEPTSSLLGGPPNRSHHRTNTGPTNELMYPPTNNHQRSQPPSRPPMNQTYYQNQNSVGAFGVNNSNNNTNSNYFSSSGNQQQNQMGINNSSSVRSYADYRSSSGLPTTTNTHTSMYPPLQNNTQNSITSQPRSFDETGFSGFAQGSSNSFGRSNGSSFDNKDSHYGSFGQQNQMEQSSQAPWHNSSNGVNNARGRGGRGRGGPNQSMNKQSTSTFSYSSNNNNNNNSSIRGRGIGRNARNFGSRR